MKEKLLSMLGIARRAGKIAMGFDAAAEAMHKGEARLLVLAADLSERTERAVRRIAEETNTPVMPSDFDMDRMVMLSGAEKRVLLPSMTAALPKR